ncbi:hypothetical protein [Oribacterium sp. P6A1]|uniref:hypothetical protein n=1 Tax=Oribacterium sp. P6A1 TaxID=1410612 RepID=UPI0012DDF29D|nr:hypothetical protein [Oribacterium sp. P6A1]
MDNDEINPTTVDGIPVIRLDCKSCEEKLDYILDYSLPVYLGTRGVYHSDIISRMKEKGFKEFVPVTVDMDS